MSDVPRECRPDFEEVDTSNLVELKALKDRIESVVDPKYVHRMTLSSSLSNFRLQL